MYRDSRITRIYEGTNEICRLYAQRALMKRAWKGAVDFDGATELPMPGAVAPDDTSFDELPARIADLKQVYLYLVRVVDGAVDRDLMFDAEHQQLVASLADVAIEIFGAESAVLRAEKARAAASDHGALVEALARLAFARAADRVRQEASEILGSLCAAGGLRERLDDLAGWLPLPLGLIEVRTLVARQVLQLGGLPTGDLQPAS